MQKSLIKDQFKKFREKRRKIPDIISLYRKKKNIKMVTQRLMNSVKRRFNAAIKEVSDLLNENREIKEENVTVFIVCKENLWTDSQCVLNWIKTKKPLSVFLRNRLTEITREKNVEFRYIHTKENPADLPSRGLSSNNLKGNS